jgi:hypothetical protein
MTADGNDLSYADALKAMQLRLSTMRMYLNACMDEVGAVWRDIAPRLHDWLALADTFTEQQWMDEPESTRAFYETWRQWFAEQDAEQEPKHNAE